jgi:hypothetical protein
MISGYTWNETKKDHSQEGLQLMSASEISSMCVDVKYHILKKRIKIPPEPVNRVVITCSPQSVVRKNFDPNFAIAVKIPQKTPAWQGIRLKSYSFLHKAR